MIEVRIGTEADVPAIAAFNRAMAWETEKKELPEETITSGVRSLLARPDLGFYVVAHADGKAVGCLLITYEWSDWRNALWWWVQSVYVLPDYRGKGLYRLLYNEVRRLAAERGGVYGFRLYVEKENTRAQQIYEHLGMSEAHYSMYEEVL
jgi:GNAT superfamily N-acetyltransferase